MKEEVGKKLLRVSAFLLVVVILLLGNLVKTSTYSQVYPALRVFYEPISYFQNGWGMYSFNIQAAVALRYVYQYPDRSPETILSSYGHAPSFWRTQLGNLDPVVASNPNSTYAAQVLRYQCEHPLKNHTKPQSISLEVLVRPMPQLHTSVVPPNQVVKGVTVTCQP